MDFKNIVLSFSNAKLASGKFRPKFNKFSIVVTALLFILLGGNINRTYLCFTKFKSWSYINVWMWNIWINVYYIDKSIYSKQK